MTEVSAWLELASIRELIKITVALVLIALLVRSIRFWIASRVSDADTRYRAGKGVVIAGYLAAAIIILTSLAGEFSGLSIALGAASAGIAFSLQEVIASFAGWVAISFSNFYRVGDRVQLGGIRGDVIDIGFLRTTLMEIGGWVDADLYNGRIVRVANSFVFKEPVFNYSGDFAFLWDEIKVPVKYGSDYELARGILNEVANDVVGTYAQSAEIEWQELVRTYRIENARLQPMVTLSFNDNWVEMTLRYLVDFKTRRSIKDRLFTAILARIEASGGTVQLASTTVELVAIAPLRMDPGKPAGDSRAMPPGGN